MLKSFFRKYLICGILILFVMSYFSPLVTSSELENQIHASRDVIIVDDEGDGDYISIIDALAHSVSSDIIEVYSGNYTLETASMSKNDITLKGIPYELGAGNDSGKPLITGYKQPNLLTIIANYCVFDGFNVSTEGGTPFNLIELKGKNNIISNNIFSGSTIFNAVLINENAYGTSIINNTFNHKQPIQVEGVETNISFNRFNNGSEAIVIKPWSSNSNTKVYRNIINNFWQGVSFGEDSIISYNLISNCSLGVDMDGSENMVVSNNVIKDCGTGIESEAINSTIFRNEICNCECGVDIFLDSDTGIVKHNNFINNTQDVTFFQWFPIRRHRLLNQIFIRNYYDSSQEKIIKFINGTAIIFFIPIPAPPPIFIYIIPITMPWICWEWFPARKPYDIGL